MFLEKEINKEFKTLKEIKDYIFGEIDNFTDCPNYIVKLSEEDYKLLSKEVEESILVFKSLSYTIENKICTVDYSKEVSLVVDGIIVTLRKDE